MCIRLYTVKFFLPLPRSNFCPLRDMIMPMENASLFHDDLWMSLCARLYPVKSLVSGALERLSRTGPGALVRCGSIFHPGGTGFRPASTLSTVVAAERALAWESGDSESSSSPALVAPGQSFSQHIPY